MIVLLQLAVALHVAQVQDSPKDAPQTLGPVDMPVGVTRLVLTDTVLTDTVPKAKQKALQLSDAYETRLKIHQIASYATLPLFAAQLIVGENLYNADASGSPRPAWATAVHKPLAYALGGLFAVNSVTGALNWWETRSQTSGLAWRTVHAALMLASDAGFAYTGSMGSSARNSSADRDTHKNWAIGSSVLALSSYVMMLSPFRKD